MSESDSNLDKSRQRPSAAPEKMAEEQHVQPKSQSAEPKPDPNVKVPEYITCQASEARLRDANGNLLDSEAGSDNAL